MWRRERRRWGSWVERSAAVLWRLAEAGEGAGERDAEGGEDGEGDAAAGHLLEEEGAGAGEEEVGAPDAEEG